MRLPAQAGGSLGVSRDPAVLLAVSVRVRRGSGRGAGGWSKRLQNGRDGGAWAGGVSAGSVSLTGSRAPLMRLDCCWGFHPLEAVEGGVAASGVMAGVYFSWGSSVFFGKLCGSRDGRLIVLAAAGFSYPGK